MVRTFFIAVAGVATLALSSTMPVMGKTVFPLYGGTGDAGFEDRCPAGQYLTGLAGRAGDVIDRIGIICSPVSPEGAHGASYYGPGRGGAGGTEQEFSCPTGTIVSGVRYAMVQPNNRIWNVDLVCHSLQSSAQSVVPFHATNNVYQTRVLATSQFSPNDEIASGLAGRYGKHVNALGLFCDARTTAVSAAPPVSTRSALPIRTTGKASSATPDASATARCPDGYVWRQASPADHVCVTPEQRTVAARQNAAAADHAASSDGTTGPAPCVPGYVWREAYAGDVVCVTPSERKAAAEQNAIAPAHIPRA